MKNFIYPQIFDKKKSLRTQALSHIIQISELEFEATKMQIVNFVFNVEQDAPPPQSSKKY